MGPDLLVLGEQARKEGFSVSLLERLEKDYHNCGGNAASYIARLQTNYRCHPDILNLAEKLFYKSPLKSVVPPNSTHPEAPFPLVFVCLDVSQPKPCDNPINEIEAKVIIEQLKKYVPGWPQDSWGTKPDSRQICLMSPSRMQVSFDFCCQKNKIFSFIQLNKIRESLLKKEMNVPEMLKNVVLCPSYDMQG